jgi:hypothetical protein
MRDVFAGVVALLLLVVAASLATGLKEFRTRRRRARESEQALGRSIITEVPDREDLVLVTEDATHFHYGDRSVDKDLITAVRVLINGSPIAEYAATRHAGTASRKGTSFEDRPDGIARDRWDVAIETVSGDTLLIECGAIRERVSQELARAVFDRVKGALEARDHHSVSDTPRR